jgi:hypothetical protein
MVNSRLSIVKSKISDLVSRFRQVQSENEALSVRVENLETHILELKNKLESNIGSEDFSGEQELLAKKDTIIENLELEKERAENKVRELEEMLMLKDNTLQVQKNTINELTEQNKLIKLAKEMSSEKGDNHELKIKINELIRDIDRCIDLLND